MAVNQSNELPIQIIYRRIKSFYAYKIDSYIETIIFVKQSEK